MEGFEGVVECDNCEDSTEDLENFCVFLFLSSLRLSIEGHI